ncbi:hypothetical protein [Streptomyces sp. NPDC002599]|uniref:hypothetical protein n=1 Tax=Streptomyces sp. NPDC002599 TaxID=3154421 RepID=UPI003323E75B
MSDHSEEPPEDLPATGFVLDEEPPVKLSPPKLLKDGPDGAVSVTATVTDPDHPRRSAVFEYVGVPGHRLAPVSVKVGPAPGLLPEEYAAIWPSELRDLPLTRWESAARYRAELELGHDTIRRAVRRREEGPEGAEKWVLELYPDLKGDDSPAGRRRLRSLTHLADIALEYSYRSIMGVSDPAAAIARSRDANRATARSWIYRARKAGFLPATQQQEDAVFHAGEGEE